MRLLSSAIKQGTPIPSRFTCEGENISSQFYWEDAPKETKSFVLILHDPDAPRDNGFTRWLLYDIPPDVTHIPEDLPSQSSVSDAGLQGKSDSGKLGYTGPCPPTGRVAISPACMPSVNNSICLQVQLRRKLGWLSKVKSSSKPN
jgi:Raf kinase inhibitor-like YbhB/YbcL family protein